MESENKIVSNMTDIVEPVKEETILRATTILPVGSTGTDLRNAINNATSGDTIVISNHMTAVGNFGIGKEITIQSTSGNKWILYSSERHFTVTRGTLILQDITLHGNHVGGGILVNSGTFNMNSNTTISYCYNSDGGAVRNLGTFNMYGGTIINNTGTYGCVCINTPGIFNMYGGTITKNTIGTGGGIYAYSNFNMYGGTITDNTAGYGGGVYIRGGIFNLSEGTISENNSLYYGGGVVIADYTGTGVFGSFTMTGGKIIQNIAANYGGGVYALVGNFNMSNGSISENRAGVGGGIGITSNGIVNITGGSYITNNTITGTGGGIYVETDGKLNITGTNYITDNIAGTDGGGVYTSDTTYTNLNTASSTVFTRNTAGTAYNPPDNATTLYPNIGFASTSITNHPLNNYDINHIGRQVTFESNGGTPVASQTVTDGEPATKPTDPTRQNYTFDGWFIDDVTFENEWDFATAVTDDMTLYAKWSLNQYTVRFESNGGTPVASQTVTHGETATKPTDPTREGYTFDSWYSDDVTFENEWDFSTVLTDDITLYAKWIINQYTFTFESNGGTPVASQTVNHGEPATKPTDPTREGYTFDGWYSDDVTFENEWDFSTVVTDEIALYAKWSLNLYTVCFECNGGTPVASQTVTHGETATKPTDPTREGYTFDGWYSDNVTFLSKLDFETAVTDVTFLDEWDFATPITEDMTLYAKWITNQYTLIFECNGGTSVDSQTVTYGESATKPTDPTRENYTFDDWYVDNETFADKWNFSTTITTDIILYAKWIKSEHTVTFESNLGTPVASQKVSHGEVATEPAQPTREGYTFEGWYIDDETFVNKWNFSTAITADITLYAKWIENNLYRCVLLIILILTLIYYMQCNDCRCSCRCWCRNYYNYILVIDRILPLI